MTRKRVLYSLKTHHENLGDVMINDLLLVELSRHADLIVDDCDVPEFFIDQLTAPAFTRTSHSYSWRTAKGFRGFLAIMFARRPFDYIFLSPGHTGRLGFTGIMKSLGMSVYALLVGCRGTRFVRVGASIGRLRFLERCALRILFRSCCLYSVRDFQSNNENCFSQPVVPDLIGLAESSYFGPTVSMRKEAIFSFRINLEAEDVTRLCVVLIKIARHLRKEHDVKSRFVAQVEADLEFFCAIQTHLGVDDRDLFIFDNRIVTRLQINEIYGGAFCVFSNRLHVALTTNVAGGRGIAVCDLSRDAKIPAAFEVYKLDNLVFSLQQAENINFIQQLDFALKSFDSEHVSLSLADRRSLIKLTLKNLFDAV